MPTPIGHAIAGSALAVRSGRQSFNKWIFSFVIFFSVLPDFDILPGFLAGDVNRYHRLFSHSLFFVTISGLAGALLLWRIINCHFLKCALWFTGAGYLHLFMDTLTVDSRAPFGCPLFMPFSDQHTIFPVQVFLDLHRASAAGDFFASLFTTHNFHVLLVELALTLPILLLTLRSRKN